MRIKSVFSGKNVPHTTEYAALFCLRKRRKWIYTSPDRRRASRSSQPTQFQQVDCAECGAASCHQAEIILRINICPSRRNVVRSPSLIGIDDAILAPMLTPADEFKLASIGRMEGMRDADFLTGRFARTTCIRRLSPSPMKNTAARTRKSVACLNQAIAGTAKAVARPKKHSWRDGRLRPARKVPSARSIRSTRPVANYFSAQNSCLRYRARLRPVTQNPPRRPAGCLESSGVRSEFRADVPLLLLGFFRINKRLGDLARKCSH